MNEGIQMGTTKKTHNNNDDAPRSLADVKNLTAENALNEIHPVGNKVMVSLKSWPTQSSGGIFVPGSYTVIRGEKYIAEIEEVGEEVKLIEKGDMVVLSMYSGHHITTKTGHAKIVTESDVIIYKKKENMETPLSYHPETFKPGINYILVEINRPKEHMTDSGIITSTGNDTAFSNNDVVTKSGTVLAIGPTNEYGKAFDKVEIGSKIIFDAYVGMPLNATTTEDEGKYMVMFAADVLAWVD